MKGLIIAVMFLAGCAAPRFNRPQQVADWAKCDLSKISYWIAQGIDYKIYKGFEEAEVCMARGEGDCKCKAVVGQKILERCAGYSPKLVIVRNKSATRRHAITIFTDYRGKKGFINDYQVETGYDDWSDVLDKVSGGPWIYE